MDNTSEKYLEKKLRDEVRKMGGMAIKFTSPYFTGMPDRMVLMPGGKIWFVEVKSTGKKLKDIQMAQANRLRDMGFEMGVIDSKTALINFIKEVQSDL